MRDAADLLDPRELRLRTRIDGLLAQRAARERRIDGLLAQRAARERRILELERRLRVKEYRINELLEERRGEPHFDAADYGAKVDGDPRDNANAVAAALADCRAAGGGTVFMPEGQYARLDWSDEERRAS